MKRLITLALLLVCFTSFAQHKPLKHIEIPDDPLYKMGYDNRNNLAETINYFSVSAHIGSIAVCHAKGIAYPDLDHNKWSLRISLFENEKKDFITITGAKESLQDFWAGSHSCRLVLSVGESQYHIDSWCLSGTHLFIDVHKDVIQHISISGLQSIHAHVVTDEKLIEAYGDITQEFWRRCAESVYEGRKNL